MKRFVFGACVQGYSHIRSNMECQDSMKKMELEDGTVIMAVADGHGSRSCPFSKTGSEIAVEVFCETMLNLRNAYAADLDQLPVFLNREGSLKVAQTIDMEWKMQVASAHETLGREVPLAENQEADYAAVYRMYGSTLLGLFVTDSYVFAFQIGDGDILYVDDLGAVPVVQSEKLLGVESHSLSSMNAWKKAVSALRQRDWCEQVPLMFLLSTDGFANSFVSDEAFLKTCAEYFSMLKEHGAAVIDANLNDWLAETSQLGCGDDTTALIAYFTDEADKRPEEEATSATSQKVDVDSIPEAKTDSAETGNMDNPEIADEQPAEETADQEA